MHPWEAEGNEPSGFVYYGLQCLIMRGPLGQWNGYVRVPEDHPFYGYSYNECPLGTGWEHSDKCPEGLIRVHGGLTFGGRITHICTSLGGKCEPTDLYPGWWFGFDTAHHRDITPCTYERYKERGLLCSSEVYRDLNYMQEEVKRLAEQLAALAESNPWSKNQQIPQEIREALKNWEAYRNAPNAKRDALHLALSNLIE